VVAALKEGAAREASKETRTDSSNWRLWFC
jgi:hypothetical protein